MEICGGDSSQYCENGCNSDSPCRGDCWGRTELEVWRPVTDDDDDDRGDSLVL
jgi:hypothetical protein